MFHWQFIHLRPPSVTAEGPVFWSTLCRGCIVAHCWSMLACLQFIPVNHTAFAFQLPFETIVALLSKPTYTQFQPKFQLSRTEIKVIIVREI